MNIIEPLVQGRKSLLAKKYVTREIDAYLMEDLEFGERYCEPRGIHTLGRRIECADGFTCLYACETGLAIVVYRKYLKPDYPYVNFFIEYSPWEISSPDLFYVFLKRILDRYQFTIDGSEGEIRKEGNAPKLLTIKEWLKKIFFFKEG